MNDSARGWRRLFDPGCDELDRVAKFAIAVMTVHTATTLITWISTTNIAPKLRNAQTHEFEAMSAVLLELSSGDIVS
jgi:hypothetical protein